MAFSGALVSFSEAAGYWLSLTPQQTITDLDDFLTPSQACIIPVRNNKKPAEDEGPVSYPEKFNMYSIWRHDLQTEIHIDSNNNYYEVSTYPSVGHDDDIGNSKKALEKAEINLNDCLACRYDSFSSEVLCLADVCM